jgi:glycosyltransferase involved in cell wall biosynthesis
MIKKPKIILFTSLPKVGGHSTLTLGLCKLYKEWFDVVEIWCKVMPSHGHSSDAQATLEAMGCRVEVISDLQGKLNVATVLRVLQRAWSERPTVFFVLAMRRLSVVFCKLLPKTHSLYYHITHDLKASTRAALQQYASTFQRLVFICPATYQEFAGPEAVCTWAAQSSEMPGLTVESLEKARKEGLVAAPERVCFGLLGRLTREKGAEDVIKFIETCELPCEFHVAGVGPFAERFEALAKEGEARPAVVKFYGTYEPTKRAEFFRQFFSKIDRLIVPSIDEWETLSMVTLEAIQHGVPVLCSSAGGLRSFGMAELGPAPEGVIDLFPPANLDHELRRCIEAGKSPLDAITRCRKHYTRFFSDSVVAQRWQALVSLEK